MTQSPHDTAPRSTSVAGVAVRWNAAAAAATLVSQLVQILVLARWLSPAEFGLAAAALAVTAFLAGLSDLGFTNALVHRDSLSRSAWASAWWASAFAGTLFFLLALVTSSPLEGLLHLSGVAPLLVASALALPLSGAAAVFQAHLQRHLQLRRLAIVEIVAAALGLAVALAWAWHRREAMALVAGQVTLAVTRFVGLGLVSSLRPAPRLHWADLRPIAGFSGYQLAERVAAHALGSFDRLLVAGLLGPAAAGYYFMASQIALKPAALLGPFTARTLLPLLARMRDDTARTAASYLRALSLLSLLAAFVYMPVVGLAGPALKFLLGPGWEPAAAVLMMLGAAGFCSVLGNACGNLALALGRASTSFWMAVVVLSVRFAAIAVGARFGGLTGAALALLTVTILSLVFDYVLPRLWLGITSRDLTRAAGWPLLPAVLGAAAMAWLSSRLDSTLASTHSGGPLVILIVAGTAGIAVFYAAARLFHGEALRTNLVELSDKLGWRKG